MDWKEWGEQPATSWEWPVLIVLGACVGIAGGWWLVAFMEYVEVLAH